MRHTINEYSLLEYKSAPAIARYRKRIGKTLFDVELFKMTCYGIPNDFRSRIKYSASGQFVEVDQPNKSAWLKINEMAEIFETGFKLALEYQAQQTKPSMDA